MHNQVEIYTTDFCGYCYRALQLLKSYNISYRQYDLTLDKRKKSNVKQSWWQNFCATNFY